MVVGHKRTHILKPFEIVSIKLHVARMDKQDPICVINNICKMHIVSTPLDSKHHMEIVSNVLINNYMYFQQHPFTCQQPTNVLLLLPKQMTFVVLWFS
jgi:hypothetical protein